MLGAHQSIAGGYHLALMRACDIGCQCVQLFTKNCNQWRARPITEKEAAAFRNSMREKALRVAVSHVSYLINLASPDRALYRKSVDALADECRRAAILGLHFVVTHPGAHTGSGEPAGLRRIAQALDEVLARCRDVCVKILLENTAGQGSCLGHCFEHLGQILSLARRSSRLGICFDTCHAFAAGYELAPRSKYLKTMRALEESVGLGRVRLFHLNDSKKPLGSRIDRHAHIGRGQMGLEPFRLLLNDARLRGRPMVIETPKELSGGVNMDQTNLQTLHALVSP
jgi:deoxyribonuclease-4